MLEKGTVTTPAASECRKIVSDFVDMPAKKTKHPRQKRSEIQQDSSPVKNTDDFSSELSPSFSSSPASSSSDQLSEIDDEARDERERSPRVTCELYGSVSIIGRRREMEDAVAVKLGFIKRKDNGNYDFFGVYDGHSGSRVARACRERLHCVVAEEVEMAGVGGLDWEKVMVASFGKMDEEVNAGGGGGGGGGLEINTVGSTAVVAVVGKEEVVVANCGDSRAVICRDGVVVPLSNDHKPERPDELERVEAAGGRVINWHGYRILGVLATSRSIGDQYLKPFVTSVPEVVVTTRTEADEFLVLASDGLWDVVSNEFACQVVRRCLDGRLRRQSQETSGLSGGGEHATEAAAVLAELAIARGSRDNISVIVVELSNKRRGRGGRRFLC